MLPAELPALDGDTYRALRAAQALVGRAAALRDAPALMHRRGETGVHAATLTRALRGAGRRAADGTCRSSAAFRRLRSPAEWAGAAAESKRTK